MNLRYVENISNDNSTATIRLYGRIGGEVNGAAFAEEMRYLSNMCSKITMRINSEGGSVLEGYTILDAMNEINNSGNCSVDTHNAGMAASMASVILCNGMRRTADNYSITMIHNAHGDTTDKVLNAINQSIQTIYKDRTHLNGDVASNLMSAETFMDCKMAMEYGFIDEVIETGKKIKLPKKKEVSALAKIYNELLTPKKMNKVYATLGLENDTPEEKVVESIDSLKNEIENQKAEKEKLEARIKELEEAANKAKADAEAEKENKAVELVENGIKKGLAKEEEKDKLVALAKIDMGTVSNMFSAIETATAKSKMSASIHKVDNSVKADGKENWTIVEWQKKDPKGLKEIQDSTPEVYNQMYDNYYKLGIGNPKFKQK